MSLPDSHTARWFVALFHQYSLSIEYWRVLAETKTLECNQLRNTIQALEIQRNDIAASQEMQDRVIEGQRELIKSLEHDLQRHSHPPPAIYNVVTSAAPPARPQTPWPSELVLSCTSSDLTSIPSPTSAGYGEDEGAAASKKRSTAPEFDGSSKRQRTGGQ